MHLIDALLIVSLLKENSHTLHNRAVLHRTWAVEPASCGSLFPNWAVRSTLFSHEHPHHFPCKDWISRKGLAESKGSQVCNF